MYVTPESLRRTFQIGYDDRLAHRRQVRQFSSPTLQERYEDGVRAAELQMGFREVDEKSHALATKKVARMSHGSPAEQK